jgi:hypothetical protein
VGVCGEGRGGVDDASCAGLTRASIHLKRDGIWLNRQRALASCLSMIFSENRYTLFRIMLQEKAFFPE